MEQLRFVLTWVGVSFALCIGGMALVTPFSYAECRSISSMMEIEYKFSLVSGCYVEIDGRFVPKSYLKGVEVRGLDNE